MPLRRVPRRVPRRAPRTAVLATAALAATYPYTGTDVPKPGDERVRLNLWLFQGLAPANGMPIEVVVESFAFAL